MINMRKCYIVWGPCEAMMIRWSDAKIYTRSWKDHGLFYPQLSLTHAFLLFISIFSFTFIYFKVIMFRCGQCNTCTYRKYSNSRFTDLSGKYTSERPRYMYENEYDKREFLAGWSENWKVNWEWFIPEMFILLRVWNYIC